MQTRRSFLKTTAAIAQSIPLVSIPFASIPFVSAAAAQTEEGLAAIAARCGIVFGSAVAREVLDDADYRRLYTRETRSITTDYALKFDALRPSESEFRFEAADALIAFAKENRLQRRGHTLIWNENAPDWLKYKSKREKARIFDEHIDRVTEHYVGQLTIWDVVNEPFWPGHGLPGGYRQGPWYDAFGSDYVARALKRVAAIDKSVRLAVNEAHTERGDEIGKANRKGMLRLIDQLQHDGVPLHAIGLQAHLLPEIQADDEGYVAFLREIAARKLEIHITEFDVDDSSYVDDLKGRDEAAAERTYSFFSKVLSCPGGDDRQHLAALRSLQLVSRSGSDAPFQREAPAAPPALRRSAAKKADVDGDGARLQGAEGGLSASRRKPRISPTYSNPIASA